MNVVYSSSDSFAPIAGVAITSLLVNNKDADELNIFLIDNNISEENKRNFVVREYGLPQEHIVFVRDKKEKLNLLQKLAENKEEIRVALVEDTTSTLNQIYDVSDFCTIHVSTFFFYGEN